MKALLFAASLFAFIYGVRIYFKRRVALFNQLVVFAMGCLMLGRFYTLLNGIVVPADSHIFNVSLLANFGGFAFLFSAAYGQMDGLVDGKQKELSKYRIAALIAPVAILMVYLPLLLSSFRLGAKLIVLIMLLPCAGSAYYNFKQFIIPDVAYGILDSIRGYNLVALILCFLNAVEITIKTLIGNSIYLIVCQVLICIAYVAIIPVLRKGSSKWTI